MSERDLSKVIEECVALLPTDLCDLRARLKDIQSSANFAPPWGQQLWWQEFCDALQSTLPFPPVEEWQKSIYRIVTTKEPPAVAARNLVEGAQQATNSRYATALGLLEEYLTGDYPLTLDQFEFWLRSRLNAAENQPHGA